MRPIRLTAVVVPLLAALWVLCGEPRRARSQTDASWVDARERLVREEIATAGITNPRVLDAIRNTPRHHFVRPGERRYSYFDMALPIGAGQTISPPYIVALMTEALDPQPTDRVLEVGTGSGYQAAVLGELVAEVYSVEIVGLLGRRAAKTLRKLDYDNVHVKVGDGYEGWVEHAPFDKIIVTCSPEEIPPALVEQLKEGGRIVIPVGQRYQQTLYLMEKIDGEMEARKLQPTFFVPMTGKAEAKRRIIDASGRPQLVNGSFEEEEGDAPSGWYYVRQAELVDEDAPHGERFLRLSNSTPGRGAQALQALAMDGGRVWKLDVSWSVKGEDLRPGRVANEQPRLEISFFDRIRKPLGAETIGKFRGSFDWRSRRVTIRVPSKSRLAVFALGMFGGTGRLSVDDIHIEAIPRPSATRKAREDRD